MEKLTYEELKKFINDKKDEGKSNEDIVEDLYNIYRSKRMDLSLFILLNNASLACDASISLLCNNTSIVSNEYVVTVS